MIRPEYMRLPINIIPQEIIDQYNLKELEEDCCMYYNIVKGMYGLLQSRMLAKEFLTLILDKFGYYSFQYTPYI